MNAISKSSKSGGGCGCGGGSKGGCGCGCNGQTNLCVSGDVGCTTSDLTFVRPRFFAGQLLTEEDLQQLMDYVVAKNRLHNQRLWGDGVVCGFEVACNPCGGGGKVTVNPGYALDCCGNDLLLGCPKELDINAMVRELKRNLLGGIDCGDPCAKDKKATQSETAEIVNQRVNPAVGTSDQKYEVKEPVVVDTTRHYCLYIRYCESQTDPVSPYATDEGCSYQACQATRVAEGVSFELRCDDSCSSQYDIKDRILGCVGDLTVFIGLTQTAHYLGKVATLSAPIYTANASDYSSTGAYQAAAAINFVKSAEPLRDISFAAASNESKGAEKEPAKDEKAKADAKEAEKNLAADSEGASLGDLVREMGLPFTANLVLDNAVDVIRVSAANLAALYLAELGGKQANLPAGTPSENQIAEAKTELMRAATQARAQIADKPTNDLEVAYASLLERSAQLAESVEPMKDFGSDLQPMSTGLIINYASLRGTGPKMAGLREALLDRLDHSPRLGDCGLRADVEAIVLPEAEANVRWQRAPAALYHSWKRYLKGCLCDALNPSCVPCKDPGVLLACLEVRDCEVISICNLKRKFVLSPTALRYWFPPISWLGKLFEKLCCPDPICEEVDSRKSFALDRQSGRYINTRSRTSSLFRRAVVAIASRTGGTRLLQRAGRFNTLTFLELASRGARRISFGRAARGFQAEAMLGLTSAPSMERWISLATSGVGRTMARAYVDRAVSSFVKSEPMKAQMRSALSEMAPTTVDTKAIDKKIDELVSKDRINALVAEALKTEAAAKEMTAIAEEKVTAAMKKISPTKADTKAEKDRAKSEAELKKNVDELAARVGKLEGGKTK